MRHDTFIIWQIFTCCILHTSSFIQRNSHGAVSVGKHCASSVFPRFCSPILTFSVLFPPPTMVFAVLRSTWSSHMTLDGCPLFSSRKQRAFRCCFGLGGRGQQSTISISSIVFPHHFIFHSPLFPPVLSPHFRFESHMCRDRSFWLENVFHGRNDVISSGQLCSLRSLHWADSVILVVSLVLPFFLSTLGSIQWMFRDFLFTHVLQFCTLAMESSSISTEIFLEIRRHVVSHPLVKPSTNFALRVYYFAGSFDASREHVTKGVPRTGSRRSRGESPHAGSASLG